MSAAFYRIRDWTKHFENNRTREMDKMRWVPVPNKHDGEGFQRIMQEKDGIQIYGCWHLILQVASKMPVRGTLLREDGTPITATILALKTGWRHPQDFQRSLDFCSSADVAWVEHVKPVQLEIPQVGAGNPQVGARKGRELKGIELEGIEGKGTEEKRTPDGDAGIVEKPYTDWTLEEFKANVIASNTDKHGEPILIGDEVESFIEHWTQPLKRSGKPAFKGEDKWQCKSRLQTSLRMVYEKQRKAMAYGKYTKPSRDDGYTLIPQ